MPIVVVSLRHTCTAVALVVLGSSLGAGIGLPAAWAQGSEWQPFKERDERASRNRPQVPLPPPLPPIERGDLDRRPGAPPEPGPLDAIVTPRSPGGQPSFRPSTVETGTPRLERLELAPIPGATSEPAAPLQPPPDSAPAPRGSAQSPPPQAPRTAAASAAVPLSQDLWRGVDMRQLESLVGPLELPPRSAALHGLWTRLLIADATPPAGGQGPSHYLALQLEALYRSGLTAAMNARLARSTAVPDDPLITAFSIRLALADGDSAKACEGTKRLAAKRDALPKLLKGEMHVLSGYCAAVQGNVRGAGLAADLAREDEVEAPFALQVLDAIGAGQTDAQKGLKLTYPKRLMVLEYRLLELLGPIDPQPVLASAEPALLSAIANSENADPRLTVMAAEAAAAIHALGPDGLAEVYAALKLPAGAANDPVFRRASLFQSLAPASDTASKLQIARQLLDDARRSGLGFVMARALARPLGGIRGGGDTGPLAVVAIEAAIASGDYPRARQLASGQPDAQAWLALADIADPRTQGVSDGALAAVDGLAQQGRLEPATLHRLATVLDALDVNVPIPLWEAANRTPQPNTGHLPETGTLAQLQEAVRRGEIGKTALLVMRTIGPDGPAKTHLVGLGDAIRALRRVGLEADARQVALEALYADWPRSR